MSFLNRVLDPHGHGLALMQRVGKLGLPIFEIEDPTFLWVQRYDAQLFHTYFSAKDTETGRACLERLQRDARVQALVDRMLRCGSGSSRLEIGKLVCWWLWRANEVGKSEADDELNDFLESDQIDTLAVLWVYGVESHEQLNLPDGITFLPIRSMPASADKAEFLRLASPVSFGRTPAPSAALLKRYQIKKIASENDVIIPNDPGLVIHRQLSEIALLLNCLTGVCCTPAYATFYAPPEVPLGPFGGSGGGSPIYDVLPHTTSSFQRGQEYRLSSLVDGYRQLPEATRLRLARALSRLAQAKCRIDNQDKALDLGIALEMVLLGAEHRNKELPDQLSLSFRLRGSWLLGSTGAERRQLYRILRRIYALRSQVAHNGFSSDIQEMDYLKRQEVLAEHFDVGERLFQKLILDGIPADWTGLILEHESDASHEVNGG